MRFARCFRRRLAIALLALAIAGCTSASDPSGSNVTIDAAVMAGRPEPGLFDRARAKKFTSSLMGGGSPALDLASTRDALRDGDLIVELATVRVPARLQLEPTNGPESGDGLGLDDVADRLRSI